MKMKYFHQFFVLISLVALVHSNAVNINELNNANRQQTTAPTTTSEKLSLLRQYMNDATHVGSTPLYAYIIPPADAHQSEYVSAKDRRIQYMSDFTGSAGSVVVTQTNALLWTDGRYYIQAEAQLNLDYWKLMKSGLSETPTYAEYLIETLPPNSKVGIDPYLINTYQISTLFTQLSEAGHELVQVRQNLVDLVWTDKPAIELKPLNPLALQFSGKSSKDKITELRQQITGLGGTVMIVSALDEIAYILNLRGQDIVNNPLFFSYLIITQNDIELFLMDPTRATADVLAHFVTEEVQVIVSDYNNLEIGIKNMLDRTTGRVVLASPSQALSSAVLPARRLIVVDSPIALMKVIKNSVEANGMRQSHIRDGVAVVKYLHWLDKNVDTEHITEISGALKLGEFRSTGQHYQGVSFGAISAFGSNAAMAHYRPTADGPQIQITRSGIYLIDSGGQYSDGTTDITRTIHLGTPTTGQRNAFTRVLKGFLAVTQTKFPPKAAVTFFDSMARQFLWLDGMDYGHGTGHGIGMYMNVHEFPPRLNKWAEGPGVLENMFTSNEPGYYKEGEYGIRIENIVQAVKYNGPQIRGDFDGLGVLTFHDITLAPIQTKLINENMLTIEEATWLNAYHARVRNTLAEFLNADEIEWLANESKDVSYGGAANVNARCGNCTNK